MRENASKLGLWLALLIFWMAVLRPLGAFYLWRTMHAAVLHDPSVAEHESWLVNTSVFTLIMLGLAALNIYGAYRLWHDRTPGSVRAAIWILWIAIPLAVLALAVSQLYLSGTVSIAEWVRMIVVNAAIAALWTAYLMMSQRVREIYHLNPSS